MSKINRENLERILKGLSLSGFETQVTTTILRQHIAQTLNMSDAAAISRAVTSMSELGLIRQKSPLLWELRQEKQTTFPETASEEGSV